MTDARKAVTKRDANMLSECKGLSREGETDVDLTASRRASRPVLYKTLDAAGPQGVF